MTELKLLKTGYPPFIHSKTTVEKLMFTLASFLVFPVLGAIYFFGLRALILILISTISSIGFDLLMKKIRKRKVALDGSEVITGVLLALATPPGVAYYAPILGSAFAIIVVKHIFGGLGNNIFNPALAGRAFLRVSWPVMMGATVEPSTFLSARWFSLTLDQSLVTTATPLPTNIFNSMTTLAFGDLLDPFLGKIAGTMGETSALLIIIAAIFLLSKKIIDWRITLTYVATVFVGGLFYGAYLGYNPIIFALYFILTGGLMLGAVFMATDYVTCPSTKNARLYFGLGCGLFTLLFRIFSQMPEGVTYSILLMNSLTPLIDRWTFPKPFGWKNERKH